MKNKSLSLRPRKTATWDQLWRAAALLGALNIVPAGRPNDKTLAAITLVGTACWALVASAFGKSIGNLLDPRPLSHTIISVVLMIFSAMTLSRCSGERSA